MADIWSLLRLSCLDSPGWVWLPEDEIERRVEKALEHERALGLRQAAGIARKEWDKQEIVRLIERKAREVERGV